jgi:RNA polymerase sigma-70 factor (ECF subfamily)
MLQETMLSALQVPDRFDGRSLRAWLYRIATNRSLNYLRDAARQPTVANMSDPDSHSTRKHHLMNHGGSSPIPTH